MNNNLPLVVSFSGGRTSAFMAKYLKLKHEGKRDLIYIFANTGKERIETLDFINKCDIEFGLNLIWVEYDYTDKSTFKVVNYETASRNGEPFEKMIKRYGIPNVVFSHCSRELKVYTINRYLRSINYKYGTYETAIGIRYDEKNRVNIDKAKKEKLIYPLIEEFKANKEFIRNWWNNQSFDLQLKDFEGNCDLCFKKSERKLLTIILENPSLINWWDEMEKKYNNENHPFFRNNKTSTDLIEMTKRPFTKSIDENDNNLKQLNLFDFNMDLEFDCICKNT